MLLPVVAFALDVASSVGMLVVGAAFLRLWARSQVPLHLLFGVAFCTLAMGFVTVGASAYDLARAPTWIDGARIFAHTAAPLMLVVGYWLARHDREVNPPVIVVGAFIVSALFTLGFWIATPTGQFALGNTRNSFTFAHALHFVLYIALVVLSARKFLVAPNWRRALVPLAFLSYAFSKYTWMLIDIDGDIQLMPFVYFWRLEMVLLLLGGVIAPFIQEGRSPAQA